MNEALSGSESVPNPRSDLKKRSRDFALRVVKLVESLPKSQSAKPIGGQLLRSGTSVAANYRAACRARSTADFIAKMGIVEEETDESVFWIELLVDTKNVKAELVEDLIDEGNQLTAIWGVVDKYGAREDSLIPHSAFLIPHSKYVGLLRAGGSTHRRIQTSAGCRS